MTQVLLPGVTEDAHVIQVGSTAVLSPLQDAAHQSLESGRFSIIAKRHYHELEEAGRGLKISVGATGCF